MIMAHDSMEIMHCMHICTKERNLFKQAFLTACDRDGIVSFPKEGEP
jgi:hypothetical protein